MEFRHCCIIGLGLLGGSLAIDLRQRLPGMAITGVARRTETLEEAALLQSGGMPVFTHLTTDLAAAREADLVVLCTPVQTIIRQLADLADLVSAGTVLTDVGSTKRTVMNAAATVLPPTVHFVGGHPMAGSERAGLAHARTDLYRHATWALCVPEGAEEAGARLADLVERVGGRPLLIDADSHDDIVALTSHLPHVLAAALANRVLASAYDDLVQPFIAGGFRDTTRIAAGNPAMWRDILLTNRDRVLVALNGLLDDLAQWRDAIRSGDSPHLEALLTTAQERRERLDQAAPDPRQRDGAVCAN